MDALSAGWVTHNSCAALLKLFTRASVEKACKCRNEIFLLSSCMALLIKKSNGFIKINKFSYPAIYHILDWSLLIMKTTNFRSVLEMRRRHRRQPRIQAT